MNSSFVRVEGQKERDSCKFTFYIYLTDGTHSIGTPSNPVEKDSISEDSVK